MNSVRTGQALAAGPRGRSCRRGGGGPDAHDRRGHPGRTRPGAEAGADPAPSVRQLNCASREHRVLRIARGQLTSRPDVLQHPSSIGATRGGGRDLRQPQRIWWSISWRNRTPRKILTLTINPGETQMQRKKKLAVALAAMSIAAVGGGTAASAAQAQDSVLQATTTTFTAGGGGWCFKGSASATFSAAGSAAGALPRNRHRDQRDCHRFGTYIHVKGADAIDPVHDQLWQHKHHRYGHQSTPVLWRGSVVQWR